MAPELLRLGVALIGHAYLTIGGVNLLHGVGLRGRRADAWTLPLGLISLAIGLGLAAPLALGSFEPSGLLRVYEGICLATALVAFPVTTSFQRWRRPPACVSRRAERVRIDRERGAAACIGRGANARLLRLPGNESLHLEIAELRLAIPGLPPALDGLSLAHLTDLHMAPCYGRAFFEAAVERAARWEADLVVVTGDLIEDDEAIAWIEPVLGGLAGRLGTLAILGNHDLFYDVSGLLRALDRAGFDAIDGRWTTRRIGEARLAIGGTSYPWGSFPSPEAGPAADFRIVLSHTPDTFPRLAASGVDLVLAGHNHGGQVRLPILGPTLMPSVYGRRYDAGVFARGTSRMVVSRGLGAARPLRWNCPPEITRIILEAPRGRRKSGRTSRSTDLSGRVR